ncbi:hypothetical protein CPT_Paso_006 [Rhizobium phage Paso]|uniref:Uncharacterized protein n=1 Tax=Rhizobium phage Paso TaxID=2767574 RepID=A0A7L8G4N0_9CAUD|nr:hypothetical protein CPT_Paso_006 [Rhizobium phage Paso]
MVWSVTASDVSPRMETQVPGIGNRSNEVE